jgi:hypothetical protein
MGRATDTGRNDTERVSMTLTQWRPFAGNLEPESGLEPLTYRLQGDTAVPLNAPVLPANRQVSDRAESANFGSFRLVWVGLTPTGVFVGLN